MYFGYKKWQSAEDMLLNLFGHEVEVFWDVVMYHWATFSQCSE